MPLPISLGAENAEREVIRFDLQHAIKDFCRFSILAQLKVARGNLCEQGNVAGIQRRRLFEQA